MFFMKKIAGLCATWLNHWLIIFPPSDPSSVGLVRAFLLRVGILALSSSSEVRVNSIIHLDLIGYS